MYSKEEREHYFFEVTQFLKTVDDCLGIVQIGSGVNGYTDEFSDIDLMIATNKNVEEVTNLLKGKLYDLSCFYLKEGKFGPQIFMLIPFFNNGLEMNISIMPVSLLPVRSPLWKIVEDKNGSVQEHLQKQMVHFLNNDNPYGLMKDIVFEFAYNLRKLHIEIKRNNIIYALKMLEALRELTLQVQGFKEGKKMHQFKAYHTLNQNFIEQYLLTFPSKTSEEEILLAAQKIKKLFNQSIDECNEIEWDGEIFKITIL